MKQQFKYFNISGNNNRLTDNNNGSFKMNRIMFFLALFKNIFKQQPLSLKTYFIYRNNNKFVIISNQFLKTLMSKIET